MIKIYKYNHTDNEYRTVVNSKLKSKEREKAIDKWIEENGTETPIQTYFKDVHRNSWGNDYSYKAFGTPDNCIERLAYGEIEYDNELSYCDAKNNHPEDLIEERTSWSEMKDYANGLYWFINQLKGEIANGKIVFNKC